MFNYYLTLSLRSLKRSPLLYGLVIITLAIGVGSLSANLALYQSMAADPLPAKSDRVYHVSMSTWPESETHHKMPFFVSRYREAEMVLSSSIPTYTVAHYQTRVYVRDFASQSLKRYAAPTRATSADFFALTDAPFAWGSGFKANTGNEVVLGAKLNQQLYAGKNSVGETIEIEGKPYTVVGVLKPWTLRPRFYQVEQGNGFKPTEQLFVPLETAIDNNWTVNGRSSSTGGAGTLAESRSQNRFYLMLWVQLDSAEQKLAFQQHLDNYSHNLKAAGEHPLPVENQLNDIPTWMNKHKVVDKRLLAFALATSLFLLVCMFNASSLLLAKYHGERFEMGLRRALGASRNQLMQQGLVEAIMVGTMSGLLALALSWVFLQISVELIPKLRPIAQLDPQILAQGFVIALLTALMSTGYPLWRANQSSISTEMK